MMGIGKVSDMKLNQEGVIALLPLLFVLLVLYMVFFTIGPGITIVCEKNNGGYSCERR